MPRRPNCERAVTELGLVGGLINGHCQGRYLDDPAYEPLFACAESMGAPIYLHPTTPHPAVMEAWFAPYVADGMHLASWGFAAETGTHVLRLIYSGLFDKFPRLQMIIGHLGEMLPFAAYRIDRYYGLGGGGGRAGDCSGCRRTTFATTSTSRRAATSARRPLPARSR